MIVSLGRAKSAYFHVRSLDHISISRTNINGETILDPPRTIQSFTTSRGLPPHWAVAWRGMHPTMVILRVGVDYCTRPGAGQLDSVPPWKIKGIGPGVDHTTS